MKKFFLWVIILFLLLNKSFAFELSEEKKEALINVKSKIWLLKPTKNINWYFDLKNEVDKNITKVQNEEEIFILTQIKKEILYIINSYKPENFDNINYNNISNSSLKKDFYIKNSKEIIGKNKIKTSCYKYYDSIDEVAKKNNFPTALIIATWQKESNCNLFNPYNWKWPFQISSQYHKPWKITLETFLNSLQEYITFSKWKINYFNSNKSYQKKFWNEKIDFNYENYSLKDLQLYAILYNWIWKNTDLKYSKFANWNLNSNIKSDTDWLVTLFLKITAWQIKNNK